MEFFYANKEKSLKKVRDDLCQFTNFLTKILILHCCKFILVHFKNQQNISTPVFGRPTYIPNFMKISWKLTTLLNFFQLWRRRRRRKKSLSDEASPRKKACTKVNFNCPELWRRWIYFPKIFAQRGENKVFFEKISNFFKIGGNH